ncbi:PilZ domain-containing protein [Hoeflea ulvae]|uniref:PilZ domain-containing protein n=1 Tax=Hoeflea ulvae TaxID=2983764 RepID=A0ABT3YH79_9HYPH|nr:PilZ domain-containing protein [Hoeflea ulvae]MCY0095258.1 PilZ domain-containing protein [Hoeflea ulvae]
MQGIIRRATPRSKTRIRARIACRGHKTVGSVLDLSELGACLYLSFDIPVAFGNTITIDTPEMGHLSGTVRWTRESRVGVQLEHSSNTEAKVGSYFKQIGR